MVSHTRENVLGRNVMNNNKTAPNKQGSIIGSKEWNDYYLVTPSIDINRYPYLDIII